MQFTFTKMEGLGNDYLYVYDDPDKYDAPALSIRLSERHFGAGSDGMIWIAPSDQADFKMRIYNQKEKYLELKKKEEKKD